MKILFCIICFIPLGTAWSQTETIKIEKDTVFNIADFVNFFESDTSKTFSFIKNKYFRYSYLMNGVKTMNCTDKAVNPPFTLVNTDFSIDYCMWNKGWVYGLELTVQNPKYLSLATISEQLHSLGFKESGSGKEKKFRVTQYHSTDKQGKLQKKYIVVRSLKSYVASIEFN